MEPGSNSSNPSSGDLIAGIKMQQTNILQRIDAFTRAAGAKSPGGYYIRQLQQKYNDLVDQRAGLEPSPFSDPFEKLPPELWPDIIEPLLDVEYPVDVLLELTSVSQTWCNALVSSPRLWRTIVFDDGRQDYLAKAVMGLSLSGSCQLSVYLGLAPTSWKEVVSFVLLETKRVQFLSMVRLHLAQAQEILSQIQEMPTLKTLHLPRGWARELEDEDLETLGLKRMPSIQVLEGAVISMGSRLGEHLITSLFFETPDEMGNETIERCQQLPNLRQLVIEMPGCDVAAIEAPDVQLSAVEYVSYTYLGFSPTAWWFGPRVTSLRLEAMRFASLEELATSLGHFPCLHSLLLTGVVFSSLHDAQKQPTILRSIKSFTLSFDASDKALDTRDIAKGEGFLCEALVAMVPCIEVLTIEYGTLTSVLYTYIEALASLVELELTHCDFIDYVPLNAKNLESLSCTADSFVLLAALVAPALRSLFIDSSDYLLPSNNKRVDIPGCLVSGETVTTILNLTLVVDTSIRWEFVSLSSLRKLSLIYRDPRLAVISSDVLEVILMRPFDLPALESIRLLGGFFEWDILLLLLERRILYSHLGISPINTLALTHDLPYKLLRPITALLAGKLPEREADDHFSLKSMKERICNEEMTGCYSCCFAFRPCDKLPVHQAGQQHRIEFEAWLEQLEVPYVVPSEYLTAEPPLQPGLAEWLSEQFTRRRELAQGYKDFSKRFHRPAFCETYSKVVAPTVIITGHSLDGTYFQQRNE